MRMKPLVMAAALMALPAAAQSAAAQPATTPDAAPASPAATATTAPASAPVPATLADLTAGAVVNDPNGAQVGTIQSATSAGAVISTGTARATIPVASFSKNSQGLLIGVTKTQLEAAVAKATPPKS